MKNFAKIKWSAWKKVLLTLVILLLFALTSVVLVQHQTAYADADNTVDMPISDVFVNENVYMENFGMTIDKKRKV